ncbi:hypothetical protein C2U68_06610 [Methylomonas koyamae]|nr:hypothetical protein C2U68_06610 [Methylomonas koyamae]
MYVVVKRPDWFHRLVRGIFDYPDDADFVSAAETRAARIKSFACLFVLFLVDIVPLPVTPVVAFAIILGRPSWFYRLVSRVYGQSA